MPTLAWTWRSRRAITGHRSPRVRGVAKARPQRRPRRRQGQTTATAEGGPLRQLLERQRLAKPEPSGTVGMGNLSTQLELQTGGLSGQTIGRAQSHHLHADHIGSSSGNPAECESPRHCVRGVHQDPRPGQSCPEPLQHRTTMAPNEAKQSAALRGDHQEQIHPDAGLTILTQELGLDKDASIPGLRWDPTTKQHVPDPRIEAMQPEAIKASLDRLLILGSREFVVTRFHGMRKLSEEYSSPTLGMFLEIGNRTNEGSLGDTAQAQSVISMDGQRVLSSSRTNAAECTGEETSSCDQVRGMCLGNSSNFCYANALLKALIYAACQVGSISVVFDQGYSQFIRTLIRRSNATTVHLWRHPIWVALTRGWPRPHNQHDAAEFLQFLCRSSLLVRSSLEMAWQARALQGIEWCTQDSGQSAPLL